MNKYEVLRKERTEKILSEAKQLILRRGIYDGIMSDLAPRAGISRQRLYLYYKGIDEVMYDIVEQVYNGSHLDMLRTEDRGAPDTIIHYSILAIPYLPETMYENLIFLSMYSVYLNANKNADIKRNTRSLMLFEKQIRDGREQGIFRTDLSVEQCCAVATNLITGYLYQGEMLTPQTRSLMQGEELLTLFGDMILAFLKGTDPKEKK